MGTRQDYGLLALLLGLVWGQAAYWLATPHPEAPALRVVLVWAQLLIALTFFAWSLRKERQLAGREKRGEEMGGA